MAHAALAEPATDPAALPLSARLRQGTRDLHDRIEANPRMTRLMAADLSRLEYRGLLARLHGHHAPAEAALAAAAPLLPPALDLPRRLRRGALLAQDLRALGLSGTALAALPRCTAAGRIASAEAAWGTLYVLEGATLGGQVIARRLAATLGLDARSGAAGLAPHGAEAGALWRLFRHLLDAAAARGEIAPATVLAAARRCFATLDAWMAAAPGQAALSANPS